MNVWAVLLAAASGFALGGLWYSPLMFLNPWLAEAKVPKMEGHGGRVFGIAFAFSLISAILFAWLLGPAPALDHALLVGGACGFGIAAASFGINYQFAQRSFRMWLIDGGYHTAQFLLYGLILGLWH